MAKLTKNDVKELLLDYDPHYTDDLIDSYFNRILHYNLMYEVLIDTEKWLSRDYNINQAFIMAEFLNQDDIDALLDIANQGEDYVMYVDEMIEILELIKLEDLSNIEIIMLLSKVKYLLMKKINKCNITTSDLYEYHNKAYNGIAIDQLIEDIKGTIK